jgi:tRNA(fMet)-specific endonuclease VapC
MTFLLDTDTCIYWLRGHESVRQQINAMKPGNLAVSIISLAELHYGADCSNEPEHNHKIVDDFVSGLTILTLEQPVARRFGEIKSKLRREGKLIEDFDLLIAATALTRDLILVTNNREHFERIENLQIDDWVRD